MFFLFFFYFSEKTSLDITCESSAKQTIHMNCQDLFSLKNKQNIKMLSAAVVIGTVMVKMTVISFIGIIWVLSLPFNTYWFYRCFICILAIK